MNLLKIDTSLNQREIMRVYQNSWIIEILKTVWSATVQSVRLSTCELVIRTSAINADMLVGNQKGRKSCQSELTILWVREKGAHTTQEDLSSGIASRG